MLGLTLRWGAVALFIVGMAALTLVQFGGTQAGTAGQGPLWLIPLGYFAMLLGAVVLCIGWYKKRKA